MGRDGIHLYYFDIDAVHYSSSKFGVESPDTPLPRFRFCAKDRFACFEVVPGEGKLSASVRDIGFGASAYFWHCLGKSLKRTQKGNFPPCQERRRWPCMVTPLRPEVRNAAIEASRRPTQARQGPWESGPQALREAPALRHIHRRHRRRRYPRSPRWCRR